MDEKRNNPEPEQITAMEPEELLKQYNRLIYKIVHRYRETAQRYAWIDDSDLQQVASIGLLKAQATYCETNGASFVHYACTIMSREIMRALNIKWTTSGYTFEQETISLDEPINGNSEITRGELIPCTDIPIEELAEKAEIAARVHSSVMALPEDQKEVIERLFLNDPTESRQQIATDKGITIQTVFYQQRNAFRNLRNKLRNLKPDMPNHIGFRSFNTRWTSEPESYVLEKERRIEEITGFISNEFERNLQK